MSNLKRTSSKLPRTIAEWRVPDIDHVWDAGVQLWESIRPVFDDAGIDLWQSDPADTIYQRARLGGRTLSNGFAYGTPLRQAERGDNFKKFNPWTALTHGATTADGQSVVVRIITIGEEGKAHMDMLRNFARGMPGLRTDNHIIPLWREIQYEDMTFAVFPLVGASLDTCYADFIKNSVGDVVDMILQGLQALAYIHSVGIAHRDTDKSNFLVQWHPESLATMQVPVSRPRVYLNDFEFAVQLDAGATSTSAGPVQGYQRDVAPEVSAGAPYDPFKPDVWQLATSFSDYQTTVAQIDEILADMRAPEAARRPNAAQARDLMAEIVNNMAPVSLLIRGVVSSEIPPH